MTDEQLDKVLDERLQLRAENARLMGLVGEAMRDRERCRDAARKFVALVDDLGAFIDDSDPRVMAIAGPLGQAQADLWIALGLDLDKEVARLQEDIINRCAVCGWTLADKVQDGCVRGNCSLRPRPERLYAPERAAKEARRG